MRRLPLAAALALSLLGLASSGCTTRSAEGKPAPAPREPDPALAGRYKLWVGRESKANTNPTSRWCYLDLEVQGSTVIARAWRPGMDLRVTRARVSRSGRLYLTLDRDEAFVQKPLAPGQRAFDAEELRLPPETWTLSGSLRRTAPKADAEEEETGELRRELIGTANVVLKAEDGSTRSFPVRFRARAADEVDEEEARGEFEDAPPVRAPVPVKYEY